MKFARNLLSLEKCFDAKTADKIHLKSLTLNFSFTFHSANKIKTNRNKKIDAALWYKNHARTRTMTMRIKNGDEMNPLRSIASNKINDTPID